MFAMQFIFSNEERNDTWIKLIVELVFAFNI